MSIKKAERPKTTTVVVDVVTCDGPGCSKSADFDRRTMPVPPGWIFLGNGGAEPAADPSTKHYCSKSCLFDWVQP